MIFSNSLVYSDALNEKVLPDQYLVNRIAHRTEDISLKKELLEMNYKNFPNSYNTNYSLGLYHEKHTSNEKAAKYYNQALAIYNDQYLRNKLNSMINKMQ